MAEFNLLLTVMLVCITIISFGLCEPHCSKFHYEEKLLEKMVRLEFKLEQFEKGYKEMEKIILEERQQNEARLSADTRKFQNETITILANLVKIPDVLFRAKDLADLSVKNNEVYVYKTVLQNEGDGYDAGSGVFTAPVDGDFLFTAQMCISANNYIYYAFVVDNVEQKRMTVHSSKYACGTGTLFSRLKKGARVWLISKANSIAHQNSNRWNVFSGILLKV